jgi:deazaflavin-dependent oxidoreductase (nitroreductase family)
MGTLSERLARVAARQTCRLTHHGRKTGKPYQVTIWFMVEGERVYLATANAARQWVRNIRHDARVMLEMGGERFAGRVEPLDEPDAIRHVMGLVTGKYWYLRPFLGVAQLLGLDPTPDASFVVHLIDEPVPAS